VSQPQPLTIRVIQTVRPTRHQQPIPPRGPGRRRLSQPRQQHLPRIPGTIRPAFVERHFIDAVEDHQRPSQSSRQCFRQFPREAARLPRRQPLRQALLELGQRECITAGDLWAAESWQVESQTESRPATCLATTRGTTRGSPPVPLVVRRACCRCNTTKQPSERKSTCPNRADPRHTTIADRGDPAASRGCFDHQRIVARGQIRACAIHRPVLSVISGT
jgi:hypothetical protein